VKLKLLVRDSISPGESAPVQLYLRDALPLGRGDRFVLRDAGRVLTFGGGEVLDPLAPPARRGDPRRSELLQELARASDEDALKALVDAEGRIDMKEALIRTGASSLAPGLVQLGTSVFSPSEAARLRSTVRDTLMTFHADHPLERGITREALRGQISLASSDFDDLLSALDDVVEEGPNVRLASHVVTFDPGQQLLREEVVARIRANGFSPPHASELGADAVLLRALEEEGLLVRVGDFYLTAEQASEARALVRRRIESEGPVTVSDVRDLLSTSRKYAVPLCEWLDSTGATRRSGDLRYLGPVP
jgi:selenocysteine-specific elongation factor